MKISYFLFLFSFLLLNNVAQCQRFLSDTTVEKRKVSTVIIPIIFRSIETNWGFGLGTTHTFKVQKSDTIVRTSNVKSLGLYTLHKQLVLGIDGNIFLPGERYIVKFQLSYSKYPDHFWGIGNDTKNSNDEKYDYKQYYIFPQLLVRLYPYLFAGISFEYQRVYDFHHKEGGLFDIEDVKGRHGSKISGGGLVMLWDSRDNIFYTSKGFYLQLLFNTFSKLTGSSFSYNNYVVDYRMFFKAFSRHVIAFQAYGYFNSGNIPIRSLAMLGGTNIMRGYYQGRYRDKNLLVIQGEYRVPIWGRFSGVGFVGVGQVNDDLGKTLKESLKYSYGGGLRFAIKKKDKLNLRFDYGWGYKSSGAYLNISEAF